MKSTYKKAANYHICSFGKSDFARSNNRAGWNNHAGRKNPKN